MALAHYNQAIQNKTTITETTSSNGMKLIAASFSPSQLQKLKQAAEEEGPGTGYFEKNFSETEVGKFFAIVEQEHKVRNMPGFTDELCQIFEVLYHYKSDEAGFHYVRTLPMAGKHSKVDEYKTTQVGHQTKEQYSTKHELSEHITWAAEIVRGNTIGGKLSTKYDVTSLAAFEKVFYTYVFSVKGYAAIMLPDTDIKHCINNYNDDYPSEDKKKPTDFSKLENALSHFGLSKGQFILLNDKTLQAEKTKNNPVVVLLPYNQIEALNKALAGTVTCQFSKSLIRFLADKHSKFPNQLDEALVTKLGLGQAESEKDLTFPVSIELTRQEQISINVILKLELHQYIYPALKMQDIEWKGEQHGSPFEYRQLYTYDYGYIYQLNRSLTFSSNTAKFTTDHCLFGNLGKDIRNSCSNFVTLFQRKEPLEPIDKVLEKAQSLFAAYEFLQTICFNVPAEEDKEFTDLKEQLSGVISQLTTPIKRPSSPPEKTQNEIEKKSMALAQLANVKSTVILRVKKYKPEDVKHNAQQEVELVQFDFETKAERDQFKKFLTDTQNVTIKYDQEGINKQPILQVTPDAILKANYFSSEKKPLKAEKSVALKLQAEPTPASPTSTDKKSHIDKDKDDTPSSDKTDSKDPDIAKKIAAFKKIYAALHESQSGWLKKNFLSTLNNKKLSTEDEVKKYIDDHIKDHSDGRAAKAWELAKKDNNFNNCTTDNTQLIIDIYKWSFSRRFYSRSQLFSRADGGRETIFSATELESRFKADPDIKKTIQDHAKDKSTRTGIIWNKLS